MTEPRDLELTEMCQSITRGELTSRDIALSCLDAYDNLDDHLKAFISMDRSHVLEQSDAVDAMEPSMRGPLAGIPIAVKDLIDEAGKVSTQGSSFFRDAPPAEKDAPVVRRLKKAGAVIFGKTNLHEFAWGGTTSNPHFGICRNPWNPDHIPGGSSGGSGAAVAARIVPGALGTDTLGSIRLPSAFCGIVGLKPTYGLLPTEGIFPLGYTLDHVGPMTRTVPDARLCLKALLTSDDQHGLESMQKKSRHTPSGSKRLKGLRIGRLSESVPEDSCHPTTWQQYQKSFELAEDEGAEVVEESIPGFETALSAAFIMTLAQAGEIHHERLAENPEGFGDDVRDRLYQGHLVSGVDYVRAQRIRSKLVDEAKKLMQRVDAWILPTAPNPASRIGEPPHPWAARFTSRINLLGFPGIAIPSGLTDDELPVSIQIVSAPYSEYLLLDIAEIIEERLAFSKDLPTWVRDRAI